jgi:hypothetical protein
MNVSDSAITISAIGTLTKNAARQLTCSISQPPVTGPIAVVIAKRGPRADGAAALGAVERRADDREAARHEERRADALERAADDEQQRRGGDAAQNRRGSERHHADQVDALAAELIAHRAADEDQRAEKQRVRLDHPLDIDDRRVEAGLKRRQRDVDDGHVDERQARAENRRDQRPAA